MDVSEEHVSSTFRIEEYAKRAISMNDITSSVYLLDLFFDPEDGGNMFLRSIG
jgi:hypothetical protein